MRLLLYFLVLTPLSGISQLTAFYETLLFFEDAVGNKDTIIIGYDEDANEIYNPSFGELAIDSPWDSIFEVRAAHTLGFLLEDSELVLSKKIVGKNEQGLDPQHNCLAINEDIYLITRVKYPPLKISWNKEDFSSLCMNWSFISDTRIYQIIPHWYTLSSISEDNYVCLFEVEQKEFIPGSFSQSLFRIDSIEGLGLDTLWTFMFAPGFQTRLDSPCAPILSLAENNPHPKSIKLFPNPAKSYLQLDCDVYAYWIIFDIKGQRVQKGNQNRIDLSYLIDGTYLISFFDQHNRILSTERFIRIE